MVELYNVHRSADHFCVLRAGWHSHHWCHGRFHLTLCWYHELVRCILNTLRLRVDLIGCLSGQVSKPPSLPWGSGESTHTFKIQFINVSSTAIYKVIMSSALYKINMLIINHNHSLRLATFAESMFFFRILVNVR